MLPKPPDQAAIAPLSRVRPTLPVNVVADPVQDIEFRSAQLSKGQDYYAHIVSKAGEKTFNVNVNGLLLKMDLGEWAEAGQTIQLKYVSDTPVLTFAMMKHQGAQPGNAELSPAGQLIGQQLKKAEMAGPASRYQAAGVVTSTPKNAQLVASSLQMALSRSGLFYESHLAEFVEGSRSLAAIRQEPQNQSASNALTLLPHQLAIQESQQLAWRGEIWPGQVMEWDIRLHEREHSRQENEHQGAVEAEKHLPVSSQVTLHLPHLGKVTARLAMVDGRMQIKILARDQETVALLRQEANDLVQAFEQNSHPLDAFMVAQHD